MWIYNVGSRSRRIPHISNTGAFWATEATKGTSVFAIRRPFFHEILGDLPCVRFLPGPPLLYHLMCLVAEMECSYFASLDLAEIFM